METPKIAAPHQELQKLVGRWSGVESLSPSRGEPDIEATSSLTASLGLEGFFLIVDYEQKRDGSVSFRGHGVCGWDQAKARYTLHWFDTNGLDPGTPAPGTWEGDVLTFHRKTPDGRHERFVVHLVEEASAVFRIEGSTDGVSWRTLLEASFRRKR